MQSVIASTLKRPGTVSYTLVIRQSARRIARKIGVLPDAIEHAAVAEYRATANAYQGKRVLQDAADSAKRLRAEGLS